MGLTPTIQQKDTKDVLTVSREYEPNDPIIDWECYAMAEGLSDDELQELIHGESV